MFVVCMCMPVTHENTHSYDEGTITCNTVYTRLERLEAQKYGVADTFNTLWRNGTSLGGDCEGGG